MSRDWLDVERLVQRVERLERRVAKLEPAKSKSKLEAGPQTASGTGLVAASTFSATGSIAGDLLTVASVASGEIVVGATITGTDIAADTEILSQTVPLLDGETLGGVGRYRLSVGNQTVAAGTEISGTYGTMSVTDIHSGAIVLGGILAGKNVVDGTRVTQFLTGAGGTGTYVVSNDTIVPSTKITQTSPAEKKPIAPVEKPAATDKTLTGSHGAIPPASTAAAGDKVAADASA